ncbi:hypothetical protein GCM10027174_19000 [Salinifilum aidingensis]
MPILPDRRGVPGGWRRGVTCASREGARFHPIEPVSILEQNHAPERLLILGKRRHVTYTEWWRPAPGDPQAG